MTITEAPAAYAASRCLAARVRDPQRWTTPQHPTRCGWCDIPTDVLHPMITGFNELVDYDIRQRTSASGAVTFGRLERDEQLRQILQAQELEDAHPPAPGWRNDEPPPAVAGGADPSPGPEAVQVDQPAAAGRPSWAGGRQ